LPIDTNWINHSIKIFAA